MVCLTPGVEQRNGRGDQGRDSFRVVLGNPGGRPKRTADELDLIAACKSKSPEALRIIEQLMTASGDDRIRLAAALAVVERGYGKPTQPTTLAGGDGGPVQVEAIRTDWVALRAAMREHGKPSA